jgi:excisionase family DNA binding protein
VDIFPGTVFSEMSHLDDLFADYPASLTVAQVSEVLGIGRATAYKWLNEGTIPAYRLGSSWVILRDEVKDVIAAGRNFVEDVAEEIDELVDDIAEEIKDIVDEDEHDR